MTIKNDGIRRIVCNIRILIFILLLLSVGSVWADNNNEFGYPDIPDNNSTETTAVGSPEGALTVSEMGGAIYSVSIDVPTGVGGMEPSLSLTYNSLSGKGIAGWGFNISGLSSITRAQKSIYYDDSAKALTHETNDAYYLDGQRLILESGTAGLDGAVYHPESNPFAKVTVHGIYTNIAANVWFEVSTPDGKQYRYGSNDNGNEISRLSYTSANNTPRINSWNLDYAEDASGNYLTYNYIKNNNFLYPSTISYGKNKNSDSNLQNTVSFTYEDRTIDPQPFVIDMNVKGSMSKRLKSICSSTGTNVYREYDLAYNEGINDLSYTRFSRLTSITEKNGSGEALHPIKFEWNTIPSYTRTAVTPSLNIAQSNKIIKISNNRQFTSADLNGDGLSDIIMLAPVTISSGANRWSYDTYAYVYYAKRNQDGSLSYSESTPYSLGPSFSGDWNVRNESPSSFDFDGDGINDFMIPTFSAIASDRSVTFNFTCGTLQRVTNNNYKSFSYRLLYSNEMPTYTVADFDADGKGDIVFIEKGGSSGKYPCRIVGLNDDCSSYKYGYFELSLPSAPKEIYSADYNSDGRADILVLYNGGYTIFWNQSAGISNNSFSDNNKKQSNTTFGNLQYASKISEGDFNGDGLTDFLTNAKEDHNWYFRLNNGDGTFGKKLACSIDAYDQNTEIDDSLFSCMVLDIDNDGKSDVIINKAMFDSDKFLKTHTYWMLSNGDSLKMVIHSTSLRQDDATISKYLLGDFNGDGYEQLMNLGYNCSGSIDAKVQPAWHLYNDNFDAASGNIKTITDGYGNASTIDYASLVNGGIYTKGIGSTYPLVDCMTPIHVVKGITTGNGVAGYISMKYEYAGLKMHLRGKGMIGMTSTVVSNLTTGTVTETTVKKLDEKFHVPTEYQTTTTTSDGSTSNIHSWNTIVDKGGMMFFSYPSKTQETDFDGNITTTTYGYDETNGYKTSELADYGNNMYKSVDYQDYVKAGGSFKPTTIYSKQVHQDDGNISRETTKIVYDPNNGLETKVIASYGSSLADTTEYSHDVYGNVTSSKSYGTKVQPLTTLNEYDATGRFIVKTNTDPESTINTFTYDTWGNVLTENDETNTLSPITTSHTYDGWGDEIAIVSPAGLKSTSVKGWGSLPNKRFFTLTQGTSQPWIKTWYDNSGHEVLVESIGEKSMSIKKSTEYNNKGQISKKQSQTGDLTLTENFTYDSRGRVSTDVDDAGHRLTNSYANRSKTCIKNGREYTMTYDAWGNIKSSSDPLSSVIYRYSSNGKPKTVVASGSKVEFTYDNVGNQLTMKDPDAGTTTYTYDAAGRILTQTDARGKCITHVYDIYGRDKTTNFDGINLSNTYGTDGNDKFRLTKQSIGSCSDTFTHDEYGRVKTERKSIDGVNFDYVYNYDSKGQLASKSYPDGIVVSYEYDAYGNKIKAYTSSDVLWELTESKGTVTSSTLGGTLISKETNNNHGYLLNMNVAYDSNNVHNMNFEIEDSTENLISRTGMFSEKETFSYDKLDRLTGVSRGGKDIMHIGYSTNGNILDKTGVGAYTYGTTQPHAVVEVENNESAISSSIFSTEYNSYGKISSVTDSDRNIRMDLTYGPDMERWKSVFYNNVTPYRTVYYMDDYEQQIDENGITRSFYYLDGGALIVRQTGVPDKLYFICTDNLGSVISIIDKTGNSVFEAQYDAWGKQTITKNEISFFRGFTGHEHLPEFDLINMNGRMYDPSLGRFLSPDDNVQMPDFSQNFNRYSYCLNNPLKYTDPSGELFGIDDAVICGAIFSALSSAIMGGTEAYINGSSVWKGALWGAFKGAASAGFSYGIGEILGHTASSFGNELLHAGAHGLSNGLLTTFDGGNFGEGFASGAASSLIGWSAEKLNFGAIGVIASTTIGGGLTSWGVGGDFMNGAMAGFDIGLYNDEGDKIKNNSNKQEYIKLADGYYQATNELKEISVIGNMPNNLVPFRTCYVKTTFDRGADHPINPRLNAYLAKILRIASQNGIKSINVSCTSNHPSNSSRSAHSVKNGSRAIDINYINGEHVSTENTDASYLQNVIHNNAGYQENYGPFIINKVERGRVIYAPWARSIRGGHYDHIHLSVGR